MTMNLKVRCLKMRNRNLSYFGLLIFLLIFLIIGCESPDTQTDSVQSYPDSPAKLAEAFLESMACWDEEKLLEYAPMYDDTVMIEQFYTIYFDESPEIARETVVVKEWEKDLDNVAAIELSNSQNEYSFNIWVCEKNGKWEIYDLPVSAKAQP